MLGRSSKKSKKKKKRSRFSFLEKYSLVLGFVLFAGLLVADYLPDHNPMPYLILGPFVIRVIVDAATGQTVGVHILRNIHPRILTIDIIVVGGGIIALYGAGHIAPEDIDPFVNLLNIVLEQFGQEIALPSDPPANLTGS